jgi:hypothetical protein
MNPPDALQLLIVTHAKGAETGDYPRGKDYAETIRNAFIRPETNELVRELSLVDEQGTGAAVRRFYVDGTDAKNLLPPQASELEKALHTLVVLLVTSELVKDDAVIERLEEIALAVKNSAKRHGFLVLGTSEEVLSALRGKPQAVALKEPQGWSVEKLGEYALRPAYAAMLALNKAHQLLEYDPATPRGAVGAGKARFFISHAKLDGLPLAHSLSRTIDGLPWLGQFYDAKDIQSGDDFKEVLEHGVLGSMLLILRTDIYDLRFWCRQEVMWAEAYDRPALLVDARAELLNRASVLGFTGIPGVRIPDGNLVRVLVEALREWVRIGILRRRFMEVVKTNAAFESETELLSRAPSLTSLAEAIKRLKEKKAKLDAPVRIVHAEPPLETNHHNAAQDLIKGSFVNGAVLSFKGFLAQLPA